MSLGVHFAVDQEQERRLLNAADDEDLMAVIEEIEEGADEAWQAATDKAWDAIHRCLSDGTDLSQVVLGGRHLHEGADYIVSYLTADQVRALARTLPALDRSWLRQRYLALDTEDYDGPHGAADFAYTWENFTEVRDLFTRAAGAGRAIVFTADQ